MKFVAIVVLMFMAVGCASDKDIDRSNHDPRKGAVYMYTSGYDFKICDGTNLIYHSYDGDQNESIAVVPNTNECLGTPQ